MDRYYVRNTYIEEVKRITLEMEDSSAHSKKDVTITEGELLSFLYIDNLNNVGEKKEYVIKGKVKQILTKSSYLVRSPFANSNPNIHYNGLHDDAEHMGMTFICVDCSTENNSTIKDLKVINILDVKPIDYEWDLNENPKVYPDDSKLEYYEKERWGEIKNEVKPDLY